jgi:hypothetical protein
MAVLHNFLLNRLVVIANSAGARLVMIGSIVIHISILAIAAAPAVKIVITTLDRDIIL